MALNMVKVRQKSAQKGHSLLKRKSDALTVRFRQILGKIRDTKLNMGQLMRQASFALAEVNYAAGDITHAVMMAAGGAGSGSGTGSAGHTSPGAEHAVTGTTAQFKLRTRIDNVSGVQLPVFEVVLDGMESLVSPTGSSTKGHHQHHLTALDRGGSHVQRCREAFMRALQELVQLASLQTAFFLLDQTIRTTNRRVNALEHVAIPRLENTIAYVTSELDEQDREEFFRLKKVQANKKRQSAEKEEEEALQQLQEGQNAQVKGQEASYQPPNILAAYEDDDIFV